MRDQQTRYRSRIPTGGIDPSAGEYFVELSDLSHLFLPAVIVFTRRLAPNAIVTRIADRASSVGSFCGIPRETCAPLTVR